jgi:hypothetical protein
MPMQIIGRSTNWGMFNFQRNTQRLEYANGLFDNFGTNAIARQHRNFFCHDVYIQKYWAGKPARLNEV